MEPKTFFCVDCQQTLPVRNNGKIGSGGTGYGTSSDADTRGPSGKVCYACCGVRDRRYMERNGQIVLYWDGAKVCNWPSTLVFIGCRYRTSYHNFAGKNGRTDVWFCGPDGHTWHGVNIGNHQIVRCKRTKIKWAA